MRRQPTVNPASSSASGLLSGAQVEEKRRPAWILVALGGACLLIAGIALALLGSFSIPATFILGFVLHLVVTYTYSRMFEGRRWALDRLITVIVAGAFTLALLPLISLLWEVTVRGIRRVWPSLLVVVLTALVVAALAIAASLAIRRLAARLDHASDRTRSLSVLGAVVITVVLLIVVLRPLTSFFRGLIAAIAPDYADFWFTDMLGNMGGMDSGGIGHAIVGTLMVTLGATLISVPIGFFTAIFLVEYSDGPWQKPLSRGITFLVDVMTGIPSIVAGLFGLALFITVSGDPGLRMAVMGSVALSVLMIPTVVRASEEMLRLVPLELREAAYALGVPKWLTIVNVVLRTAVAGLTTAVTLAIARVIGETAPLLLTVGGFYAFNTAFFNGRIETLPTFINEQYRAGRATCNGDTVTNLVTGVEYGCNVMVNFDRAWAAALTLIIIVMVLNVVARLVSYFFSPKLGR